MMIQLYSFPFFIPHDVNGMSDGYRRFKWPRNIRKPMQQQPAEQSDDQNDRQHQQNGKDIEKGEYHGGKAVVGNRGLSLTFDQPSMTAKECGLQHYRVGERNIPVTPLAKTYTDEDPYLKLMKRMR